MKGGTMFIVAVLTALGACFGWLWYGTAGANQTSNPAVCFEIPVSDLDRAVRFYGALAKGEIYVPSKTGLLVYLHTSDIDLTLKKVGEAGGEVLYRKT